MVRLPQWFHRLALPGSISNGSLRTLQAKLVRVGAQAVSHARTICFQVAEVTWPRNLFAAILRRIRQRIQAVPV